MDAADAAEGVLARLFAERIELPETITAGVIDRLPRSGGVCALTTAQGALVLLLATASLRRGLAARLTPDEVGLARKRAALAGVVRMVWWQPAHSAFEADWLYLQRVRQIRPEGARKPHWSAAAWYALTDLEAAHPRWIVTAHLASAGPGATGTITAGPFDTRKHCARYIADLEDLFDLCRYHQELVRAPQGRRCEYFDMGKCPGPCDGTIVMDAYRRMVAESAAFALGDGGAFVARQEARMAQAADALAFEQAQQFRDKAARARAVQAARGRLARSPDDFNWLIVQRAGRRGWIKPFFCRGGALASGAAVRLRDVARVAEDWSARMRAKCVGASDKARGVDAGFREECIALVSHYLAKRERTSGLFLSAHEADAVFIAQRIHACYSRS